MKILLSVKFVPGTNYPTVPISLYPRCQPRSRTRRLRLWYATYYYVPLLRFTLPTPSARRLPLPIPSPFRLLSPSLFTFLPFPLYYILLLHSLLNPSPLLFCLPSPSLSTPYTIYSICIRSTCEPFPLSVVVYVVVYVVVFCFGLRCSICCKRRLVFFVE